MEIIIIFIGSLFLNLIGLYIYFYFKNKKIKQQYNDFILKIEDIVSNNEYTIEQKITKARELALITNDKNSVCLYILLDGLLKDLKTKNN